MGMATAFVLAVTAVMQVDTGNRDSNFSRCCMRKICKFMHGKQPGTHCLCHMTIRIASIHIAIRHIPNAVRRDK